MKRFAIIPLIFLTVLPALTASTTLEDFAPHFPTNTEIVWKALSNNLPQELWIYRKLPHVFPSAVISNAFVLASLESKGFPKPTTNDFFIWQDKGPNYPGPIPSIFSIQPGYGTLSYSITNYASGACESLPNDETILTRAWKSALQLGLDTNQLLAKNMTSHVCGFDERGRENTNNQICGRGVFLSRHVDGIPFMGTGDDGWSEGFWIEFGSHSQIRAFSLSWPKLERYQNQRLASPRQIIACIRAHKIIVLPNASEEYYFERIKTLSIAKKIIIAKITPYYGESIYGETPKEQEPPKWVAPVAELEAVADFGNTNANFRILAPILSSDVTRLLNK